ncbi:1-acyl-sn-glycerol-3-phosphate acyltransferase, partial [Pseudomonas aeruginosa]
RLLNQRLAEQLHRGRNLLISPEGTTTNGESLSTFHGRLMASALEAGVAVQPVAISYRRDGFQGAGHQATVEGAQAFGVGGGAFREDQQVALTVQLFGQALVDQPAV